MRTATRYPHIERDDNGKLYVAGSGHKVILLIADHVAWRMVTLQPIATMFGACTDCATAAGRVDNRE